MKKNEKEPNPIPSPDSDSVNAGSSESIVGNNPRLTESLGNGLLAGHENSEKVLRESEETYRKLMQHIPDGLYKSTPEGKFLDVNPALVRILGYGSREEIMNINILTDLYVDISERKVGADNAILEIQLIKKDGSRIWVEDHGWFNRDEQGNITSHEGILRDITERKLAEESLKNSLSLLNATIESTEEGLLAVDKNKKITLFNKRFFEMWNYPAEFLFVQENSDMFNHAVQKVADQKQFIKIVEDYYQHPEKSGYNEIKLIDGRTFSRFTMPQKIGQTIVGRVWSFKDITERIHAEEALLASEDKYRTMIEHSNDLIWTLDKQGNFTFANELTHKLIDPGNKGLTGRLFLDFISPRDLQTFMDIQYRTTSGENCSCELTITKNGIKKLILSINTSPIYNHGKIDGTVNFGRDITDRKVAEEALEEKMNELIRFHDLTVDRELSMIELKKEVNMLLNKLGEKDKYKIVE
ncbi:MAG TPA: PAS domain-containing protein [Paludibacter sp.]|nr:PAS domain-containing protein [Paludibacter sp.]